LRDLAVIYVKRSIVLRKSKQNQMTSTKKMNNNAEYARRYVHGVADGDAFSDSNRSMSTLPEAGKNNSIHPIITFLNLKV